MGALGPISDWIERGSFGDWSPSHPSDAQRESMLFLAAAFVFILLLWQGKFTTPAPFFKRIPDEGKVKKTKRKITDGRIDSLIIGLKWYTISIPLLVPFKLLTVLYHELGHAVVGMLSIWWKEMKYGMNGERGRIEYIMVDRYEGGLTQFGGGTEPNYKLTLPAGYRASCLIGCWFLFTGFDAKWSKFGAITLFLLTSFATLVCFLVRAKSGILQNWHRIGAIMYKWIFCNKEMAKRKMRKHQLKREERNETARYKHDSEGAPTEKDLHASQDIIMGCSLLVGVILFLAWNWDDSIYLRFVMLFMGLLSALYAVWDIVLDGLRYAKVAKSDVTYMADEHNKRADKYNEKFPEGRRKHHRSTRFYALIWLLRKTSMIILVIVIAYFVFHLKKSEQAIESREFLPAQFHYGPADLEQDAKIAGGRIQGTVKDWMGVEQNGQERRVFREV
ncbi:uncharacterized protein IL334_001176 [Kwoniella shivajii]|uniref:Peptidase M50 domain-containing protein n=1 Tax=Kwoniella shivajii TaxID=564305 RepID=A0ABZ1CRJ8_9TREE|nr:hypothetical protein IL334_001176 [Kwoniella shivajii]